MPRPRIKKPSPPSTPDSPEELFYSLSGRAKSHAYLRGPQQDALRDYVKHESDRDIAFELPTGAGKTTVGLLIAEWQRRRHSSRAAFLTLTNQLAAQVLAEARSLGISAADLRGNRERRSRVEEGRFLEGSAVGISTYSNLFNVNPIISGCELLVLDDAHGGGDVAAGMWTINVTRENHEDVFSTLSAILSPLMTETQLAELNDASAPHRTVLVDVGLSTNAHDEVVRALEKLPDGSSASYAWGQVRGHLHACHIVVSTDAVFVRPYVCPTFSHTPFSGARKRIYLSATLGDVEDLKRAFAIGTIRDIRAAHKQDGRRFVFVPGLVLGDDQTFEAVARVWEGLEPKRAVVIAPSFNVLNLLESELDNAFDDPKPMVLNAKDIEDSLDSFTDSRNTILGLANRYDGLDLPDDDCRLLILGGSPRATNDLEANLSSSWKLGPALRWREATRMVQGMGRCTRNATDYAVICLLGQSLINLATNSAFLKLLPPSLQAEIEWGKNQIQDLKHDPESFAQVVLGLVDDDAYRADADQAISEIVQKSQSNARGGGVAAKEVTYAKAIWDGDFSGAHETARSIVDLLSGDEWAGYRCWWLYQAAISARHGKKLAAELDALKRAKATGVNAGWLDHVIRIRDARSSAKPNKESDVGRIIAEQIWTTLEELGWSGKRFPDYCDEMLENLGAVDRHTRFHRGLSQLGRLLGAHASVPGNQGDPDVIWRFGDQVWVCFEAKAAKQKSGLGLSKKDLLEAQGHVNWVRFFETQGKKGVQVIAVIVSATDKVQEIAKPHREALHLLKTETVMEWAKSVTLGMTELRTKYVAQDFGECLIGFVKDLDRLDLDFGSTTATIKRTALT